MPIVRCHNNQCHKLFTVSPWQITAGKGKFCSRVCRYNVSLADRFWQKVLKTDTCWLWTAGTRSTKGYGLFHLAPRKMVQAHRMAYILTYGPIPDTMLVCHNCPDGDNRLCVRPEHLFLGTNQDNMDDAVAKGRYKRAGQSAWLRGEKNSSTILTTEDVLHIRTLQGTMTGYKVAAMYNVSSSSIYNIWNGRTWKHLDGAPVVEKRLVHNTAKLTPEQVIEIRQRLATGETAEALAMSFSVTTANIHAIRLGKSWRHLPDAPNYEPRPVNMRGGLSGTANGRAKLTEEDVRHIRAFKGQLSSAKVAELFHVTKATIKGIWSHRLWKSIEPQQLPLL